MTVGTLLSLLCIFMALLVGSQDDPILFGSVEWLLASIAISLTLGGVGPFLFGRKKGGGGMIVLAFLAGAGAVALGVVALTADNVGAIILGLTGLVTAVTGLVTALRTRRDVRQVKDAIENGGSISKPKGGRRRG